MLLDQMGLFLEHSRASLVAVALFTVAVTLAWREYVPLRIGGVWCAVACTNYLAQGLVCWRMARAPSLIAAMPRWMPWLYASVAVSSTVWGAAPWFFLSAPVSVLLFVGLFDAMLLFCVLLTPNTIALALCASLPLATLTTAALASRQGLLTAAVGFALIVGIVFIYALRVNTAIRALMIERHAAKELADELRVQQQRVIEIEKERSVLLERQRLMRDMHDGMGSALLTSLAVVEQGHLDANGLADILRECVGELRMVIDSLEPMDHDLATVLATLRYRLGSRLEASGVALDWQVQDLPALDWMGPTETLQVMRIVQEVLANVIKHAQAKRVVVSARESGDAVLVCFSDDGVGFDTAAASSGRGLRSLSHRSRALGGQLELVSRPGIGASVHLKLPLRR